MLPLKHNGIYYFLKRDKQGIWIRKKHKYNIM